MLGRVIFSCVHRGDVFVNNNVTYLLLNGQSASRTTYTEISSVWPSGAYGGGDITTDMHFPDVDGLCLRGADFESNNDPDKSTRTALSGFLPVGDEIGSFQANTIKSHSHVSGTQNLPHPDPRCGGGGEGPNSTNPSSSSTTSTDIIGINENRPIHFNKSNVEFDVDTSRFYMYIAVST